MKDEQVCGEITLFFLAQRSALWASLPFLMYLFTHKGDRQSRLHIFGVSCVINSQFFFFFFTLKQQKKLFLPKS